MYFIFEVVTIIYLILLNHEFLNKSYYLTFELLFILLLYEDDISILANNKIINNNTDIGSFTLKKTPEDVEMSACLFSIGRL